MKIPPGYISCDICRRFHEPQKEDMDYFCDAFPDGIPVVITFGEFRHDKPFEGDHGLLFERMPEGEERKVVPRKP